MPCGRASPFRRVVCHNASLLIKLNSWLIASWQVELRLDTALLRRARHCFTGKVGPWHRDGLPCRQLNPPPHRALRTLMGSRQPCNPDLRNTGELSRETLTLQGTNGFTVGHPRPALPVASGGSAAVVACMVCADPTAFSAEIFFQKKKLRPARAGCISRLPMHVSAVHCVRLCRTNVW